MDTAFNFMATGIGSVPFLDVEATCKGILELYPDIPFWPQFVKRSPLEDMAIQASQGLPLIRLNRESGSIRLDLSDNQEDELISFYEHFMAEDADYFAIDREHASGLYTLIEMVRKNPNNYGPYIKGQIAGPITFAGSLMDATGRSALYNSEVMDTIVKGLAIKALWLAKAMSIDGKRTILFLDEPYLSGYGSAFTPIQRHEVISYIREIIEYVRSRSNVILGIHCCGNTDWSMIIETGVDIVSFDAVEYLDYLLLYKNDIKRLLQNGGGIAWGVVPTVSFTGKETIGDLRARLEQGLNRFYEWGLDRDMVAERSLITPACGVGSIEPALAEQILALLSRLSGTFSRQSN
jgi:methionine synthase II (cobalamin-independent)